MEARVAVLEEIAASTKQVLVEIKSELRGVRDEIKGLRGDHDRDFRLTWGGLIVGGLALLGVIAHGFHWL